MKGVPLKRPIWTVARIERGINGFDDGFVKHETYWTQADATAERDRLEAENTDESYCFVVVEATAIGVYPAGEQPPWVDDRDRPQAPRLRTSV